MDDERYYNSFINSSFAQMWYQCIKATLSLCSEKWDDARKQLNKEINKRGIKNCVYWSGDNYFREMFSRYKGIIQNYPEEERMPEMLCDFLGVAGARKKGMGKWRKNNIQRLGIQFVFDVAEVYADNNYYGYNMILKNLSEFKTSVELKDTLIKFFSKQMDIYYSQDYSVNNMLDLESNLGKSFELIEQDISCLAHKIKESLSDPSNKKADALVKKNIKGILKGFVLSSKKEEKILSDIKQQELIQKEHHRRKEIGKVSSKIQLISLNKKER